MKKLKDFIRDYRETGEAETEITISLWHFVWLAVIIVLLIMLLNR